MANLKKRKIRKSIARRTKLVDNYRVARAWRNIFVQAGVVNEKERAV